MRLIYLNHNGLYSPPLAAIENEHFLYRYPAACGGAVHYVEKHREDILLKDIAYTLQVGREAMEERLAFIAENKDELIEKLKGYVKGKRQGIYIGNIKKKNKKSKVFEQDEDLKQTI